jgi:hypothetical protein
MGCNCLCCVGGPPIFQPAAVRARVFSAACDPLFTPRPFGPLLELASAVTADLDADDELAAQVAAPGDAFDVATALLRELRLAASAVEVVTPG